MVAPVYTGPAYAQAIDRTDPQREIELARENARNLEDSVPLARDPALKERANRIAHALVEVLPDKTFPYEFRVLALQDFNSFHLGGGLVYLTEGLMSAMR